MTQEELKDIARCGETTTIQFKEQFTGQKEIAKEMVAFANTLGGRIFFGVKDKTGELIGLSYDEIQTISRDNEQVRPTIYINTDVIRADGKHFLVCTVAQGKNKPYKNLNGEIWVKQGADKRRITENAEILALFQDSGSYQADAAGVAETSFNDLDRYALNDYLKKVYALDLDILADKAEQLLKNIHVLNHNGIPTLAGYLFFGKHPEYYCPTFMVKAVSFFGNELAGTQYRDTKEIIGNMPQIYEKSMSFLKSNLHNLQEKGASFNTLGKLEIAEEVLEEVLQNALVHRDLLRSAPIRIFIFDNRVEIISPGALAGGLTEEDIRNGKTYQRNPYMATFATNALHYRGIGSGIVRILAEYPEIEIVNDVSGKEFKVIVWRKEYRKSTQKTNNSTQISTQKVEDSTQTSIQKECLMDSDTTQKSKITTQKDLDTTQKSKITTPKDLDTTQKSEITTQKDLDATQKKILEYFKNNPNGTRVEAANEIGNITEDGVKFVISKLQKKGLLKRVGGRKHGEWQVLI